MLPENTLYLQLIFCNTVYILRIMWNKTASIGIYYLLYGNRYVYQYVPYC